MARLGCLPISELLFSCRRIYFANVPSNIYPRLQSSRRDSIHSIEYRLTFDLFDTRSFCGGFDLGSANLVLLFAVFLCRLVLSFIEGHTTRYKCQLTCSKLQSCKSRQKSQVMEIVEECTSLLQFGWTNQKYGGHLRSHCLLFIIFKP